MKGLFAALIATLVVAGNACYSSENDADEARPFDVSGYDRSCVMAVDCSLVFSGDPCGCSCDQIAIASSELQRYFADRDAYESRACPEGAVVCGPCAAQAVECTNAQCGVLP